MLCTLALTLMSALPQGGDSIVLTDGKVLEGLRVDAATYQEVRFRRDRAEGKRDADKVLEVRYDLGNPKLEDYALAMDIMDKGDFALAVARFSEVLEDDGVIGDRRFGWVKQNALWNQVRCLNALGDTNNLSATVDRLLAEVPDTFFYAPALLMKADALRAAGKDAEGRAVYQLLDSEVGSKGLPERWAREAELGLVLLNPDMEGRAKQQRLQGLAEKNASSYPTVANRARVEVGNVMVKGGDFTGARKFFQSILDSGSADLLTMAAALSGMGDCAYQQGLATDDQAAAAVFYEEAALSHLQVAAYYKEAARLRPRSLCFAGEAMYRIGGDAVADARTLARKLQSEYPNSAWRDRLFSTLNLK